MFLYDRLGEMAGSLSREEVPSMNMYKKELHRLAFVAISAVAILMIGISPCEGSIVFEDDRPLILGNYHPFVNQIFITPS